jgi:hypothetical protein
MSEFLTWPWVVSWGWLVLAGWVVYLVVKRALEKLVDRLAEVIADEVSRLTLFLISFVAATVRRLGRMLIAAGVRAAEAARWRVPRVTHPKLKHSGRLEIRLSLVILRLCILIAPPQTPAHVAAQGAYAELLALAQLDNLRGISPFALAWSLVWPSIDTRVRALVRRTAG